MITAELIADAVERIIPDVATSLRPDVLAALERAHATERSARGRAVLLQLIDSARIASEDRVPVCQDTGTVWVHIELGADDTLSGDVPRAVDAAVARAYRAARLRMSLVGDPLFERRNTGDNTPAIVDLAWRPGTGATIHVMLKGAGSDNASRIAMLTPDAGAEGVFRFVLETVEDNAARACPPLVVGVGVGGTFDTVGSLAKRALLREVGTAHPDRQVAMLEERILGTVNALGIGPGGLGGDTTALAVHVETAPAHIASLPVAVNLGCVALRSGRVEVGG